LGPIPNPQSPNPKTQNPIPNFKKKYNIYLIIKKIINKKI